MIHIISIFSSLHVWNFWQRITQRCNAPSDLMVIIICTCPIFSTTIDEILLIVHFCPLTPHSNLFCRICQNVSLTWWVFPEHGIVYSENVTPRIGPRGRICGIYPSTSIYTPGMTLSRPNVLRIAFHWLHFCCWKIPVSTAGELTNSICRLIC